MFTEDHELQDVTFGSIAILVNDLNLSVTVFILDFFSVKDLEVFELSFVLLAYTNHDNANGELSGSNNLFYYFVVVCELASRYDDHDIVELVILSGFGS